QQFRPAYRVGLDGSLEDRRAGGLRRFLQLDLRPGAAGYAEILALHRAASVHGEYRAAAGPGYHRLWTFVQQHGGDRRLAAESGEPDTILAAVELHRSAAVDGGPVA